jgi:hypothetical protein
MRYLKGLGAISDPSDKPLGESGWPSMRNAAAEIMLETQLGFCQVERNIHPTEHKHVVAYYYKNYVVFWQLASIEMLVPAVRLGQFADDGGQVNKANESRQMNQGK